MSFMLLTLATLIARAEEPAPSTAPAAPATEQPAPPAQPAAHVCACKAGADADAPQVCADPSETHASDATPHVCNCGQPAAEPDKKKKKKLKASTNNRMEAENNDE